MVSELKLSNLRCRGLATDLMIAEMDGEVRVCEDYVVARTPASPNFWWGNFVLFREAPKAGQVRKWEGVFDEEIGGSGGRCETSELCLG